MAVDPDVVASFAAGVRGVGEVVAGWTADDWARPACGTWTGTELAGHLATVIGWYHDWLDRAEAGDAAPAFLAEELDAHTASSLAALPAGTGPDRVADFTARADGYGARLLSSWDLPYGYPRGTVTAGLHAALASWEWHVHAWDLAAAVGRSYRPDGAAILYARGVECFTRATGIEVPDPSGDPWTALLRRAGRHA